MIRWSILAGAVLLAWLLVRAPGPRPSPPDGLRLRMQAAYTADPAPLDLKRLQRDTMVGIYEAMAIVSRKQRHQTTGDLLGAMHDTAALMLDEEKGKPVALVTIRKEVVAGELASSLGTDPEAKLDPVLRPKAVETFNRLASALGGVQ